jgi:hypothetical protein
MPKPISEILSTVKRGIAKTNLYSISIPNKLPDIEFNGKGTQLPASELGMIEVPYRGRKIKVPGQRTFSEWTVTIMETEEMGVRNRLEAWMNELDNAESGLRKPDQMVDITVKLLKNNNSPSMTYILFGAFPTSIASVDLSFDEQTAPLEYQVTFNYSYHTVHGGGGGGAGGGGGGGLGLFPTIPGQFNS